MNLTSNYTRVAVEQDSYSKVDTEGFSYTDYGHEDDDLLWWISPEGKIETSPSRHSGKLDHHITHTQLDEQGMGTQVNFNGRYETSTGILTWAYGERHNEHPDRKRGFPKWLVSKLVGRFPDMKKIVGFEEVI